MKRIVAVVVAGLLGIARFLAEPFKKYAESQFVFHVFAVTDNNFWKGSKKMPDPMGSEVVTVRASAGVSGTGAANDIIRLAEIPAGAVVEDWALDADDLDSGTNLLAVDLGVLKDDNSISTDAVDGGKWLAASTGLTAAPSYVDRAAGTAATKHALARMGPSNVNRTVALKVTTAGNAAAVASAKVGLKLSYRASYHGN